MSECNYCTLQRLKQRAKKKNIMVRINGKNVFIVPENIPIEEIRTWRGPSKGLPNGDKNHEKYFAVWFMRLPNSCCC